MIRFVLTKDYDDMSRKAANIIGAQVVSKPNCVLGLATGSTPIGTYQRLVEGYEAGYINDNGELISMDKNYVDNRYIVIQEPEVIITTPYN